MGDRIKGFTVVLDKDIHEDAAREIENAILMLRHVQKVGPLVADATDYIATNRVRIMFFNKIAELLTEQEESK